MVNKKQNDRLIDKVSRLESIYKEHLIKKRLEVRFDYFEDSSRRYDPPRAEEYRKIEKGARWGKEFGYAWFGADLELPEEFEKENVFLECRSGAIESLVFLEGKPYGMFDDYSGHSSRLHKYLPLDFLRKKRLRLDIEGYASHKLAGTQPYEKTANFIAEGLDEYRIYGGFFLVSFNRSVSRFIDNLHLFNSLYQSLEDDDFYKGELVNEYINLFKLVDLMPSENIDDDVLDQASEAMEKVLDFEKPALSDFRAGVIGHSHLDTAWLWKVEETKRKAARTASTAVRLLKNYDNYKFIMSSALHLDWFKRYYPELFADIKELTAQKKFEPNGAVWVECDCNLTGGEAMVRQFVMGQQFLLDELGYEADTFWLPDTFGYSAALPQIMNQCNVKYFCTTKMSWNDTTKFPYDTFIWEGMDGSRVLSHFICIHCFIDPKTVSDRIKGINNRHLSNKKLIAYGFGDGGGGPDQKMVEYALRTEKIPHAEKVKHITVSDFMKSINTEALPIYSGELYLELHRGTLTAIHDIKKLNRALETSLHNLEFVCATLNRFDIKSKIDELYKILLLNQFHDILPGTCITEVNKLTIEENTNARNEADKIVQKLLENDKENKLTLLNTLSFDRNDEIEIDSEICFENSDSYTYENLDGNKKTVIAVDIPAFSSRVLSKGKKYSAKESSSFKYSGNILETPGLKVEFDSEMRIIGLFDKNANREVCGGKLNDIILYRDVPKEWDNWDIDADYILKGKECRLESTEIVCNNAHAFRLRNKYKISERSTLLQDMVFNARVNEISFESKLDWHDKHYLLKANFETNIFTKSMKNETQFGYVERSVLDSTDGQQAMFEVCNHKWTDLSENNYGVALLNDCKYGISGKRGKLDLTLVKSGTHPDYTADEGIKYFNYKLVLHKGGFSFENVTKKAYEYNIKPICVSGETHLEPIVKSSNPAVIIETVKPSEKGQDIVLRLYESEGNHALTNLVFKKSYTSVLCNMLEKSECESLTSNERQCRLKPFEILTIKLKENK